MQANTLSTELKLLILANIVSKGDIETLLHEVWEGLCYCSILLTILGVILLHEVWEGLYYCSILLTILGVILYQRW